MISFILFSLVVVLSSCGTPETKDLTTFQTLSPEYETVYDIDKLNSIYITIDNQDWKKLGAETSQIRINSFGFEFTYVKADIEYNGEKWESVGIRHKGNSSFAKSKIKKSFKIDFTEFGMEKLFYGFKKLNLNNGFHNPALLRECLTLDIFNKSGVPSPKCNYMKVYLDKNDGIGMTYWGIYTNIEQIDKTFLRNRFGLENSEGNLYKPMGMGDFDNLERADYEKKTNTDNLDKSDLENFANIILNCKTANDVETKLMPILNTDSFLKYIAINNILNNWDSYGGHAIHNFYLYNNPSNPNIQGKDYWEFITWDVNSAFGVFNGSLTPEEMINMPWNSNSNNRLPILLQKLLLVPSLLKKYKDYFKTFISQGGIFDEESVIFQAEKMHELVYESVRNDYNYEFTFRDYAYNINNDIVSEGKFYFGITKYIKARISFLQNSLY